MKAGAFTPATPSSAVVDASSTALNEGGGFHPRNPSLRVASGRGASQRSLNEGGGFHPRNPASKTLSANLRDFWQEQVVILTDHTL